MRVTTVLFKNPLDILLIVGQLFLWILTKYNLLCKTIGQKEIKLLIKKTTDPFFIVFCFEFLNFWKLKDKIRNQQKLFY